MGKKSRIMNVFLPFGKLPFPQPVFFAGPLCYNGNRKGGICLKRDNCRLPEPLRPADEAEELLRCAAEDEGTVEGYEFRNASFPGLSLGATEFRGCRFEDCRLTGGSADGGFFTDVLFENCDLSNFAFQRCGFRRVEFRQCKAVGADFSESFLEHTLFEGCKGRLISLVGSKLKYVLLKSCDFAEGNFGECTLASAEFTDCVLKRAVFLHTPLKGMDLTSDDIEGIILSGPELRGAAVTPLQACDLARYLGLTVK